MQILKKQPSDAERKPAAVQVKSIKAKGGIDVDLKLHDAANETSPAKPAPKSAPKTEVKADKKPETLIGKKAKQKGVATLDARKGVAKKAGAKSKTKNELFAALEERTSTLKYRAWGAAGLALIVVALLVAQFTGGEEAPVATAAPVSPESAPVVVEPALASVAAGDNSEMVNNIIGALRRSQAGATEATIAAPVTTEQATAINSLYTLVTGAFAQGQSEAYIDQLLNESLQSGEITVPAALMLPDGRVDTKSVMAMFGAQ